MTLKTRIFDEQKEVHLRQHLSLCKKIKEKSFLLKKSTHFLMFIAIYLELLQSLQPHFSENILIGCDGNTSQQSRCHGNPVA